MICLRAFSLIMGLALVNAFQVRLTRRQPSLGQESTTIVRRRNFALAVTRTPTKSSDINVKFTGKQSVTTVPFRLTKDNEKSPNDFFATKKHRDLLMSKDQNLKTIIPSKEMVEVWASESKAMGGCVIHMDAKNDETCEVVQLTTFINFPGLRLVTKTIIGTKLVLPTTEDLITYPEYQFTLIDTEFLPEGARPLVWLFDKLTGAGKAKHGGISKERKSSSFTRVKMVPVKDGDFESAKFSTDAYLETRINIPSVMMRLLPLSLEKFEEQGSTSMQKTLEKDVGPALDRFRSAYMNWSMK